MPEIIQFSNNLCYEAEPLIPLRQYGGDRLTPVVSANYVAGGYEEGARGIVNPPEARAIVDRIKEICSDPQYEGKSIGVISLMATSGQPQFIERLLINEIGPQEMNKRRLICGDSYAFQGDERDVMFLSLVRAPTEGRPIPALTSLPNVRRFNVAASRAKDQMILYHSVTINDLRNPEDLRRRLLDYCQNPRVEPIEFGFSFEDFQNMNTSDRANVPPPSPFDSWFELDVFSLISKRGYRVIPQFEVARYRIDMVVIGMEGRLAVECDGDAFHGSDRYEADSGRERVLERCGWTFWRVRGSDFYRNPNRALESLWGTLHCLGIFPSAQEASDFHLEDSLKTDSSTGEKERNDRVGLAISPDESSFDKPPEERTPLLEAETQVFITKVNSVGSEQLPLEQYARPVNPEIGGNQFVNLEMANLPMARRYGVIWINEDQRLLFPGYEIPFELETDIGVLTAQVSSSTSGNTIGDSKAGQFIQGGLQDWYRAHNELRAGARLRIEALEQYKRYRLTIIDSP